MTISPKPSIFVASSSFGPQAGELLKKSGYPYSVNTAGRRLDPKELVEMGQGSAAVIAGLESYDAGVLEHWPQLRCISRCGVGVDNIDLAVAQKRGVKVFTTPDVVVQPVAELTLAMVLDLLRKVTFHTELMRQKKWERRTGAQLAGAKVGIVGLGRIGRQVAVLLRKLDAEVCGYDLVPDQAWAKQNNVRLLAFYDLLKECDIVTLHISVTPEYPFCLGAQEMAHMKQGAMLVNVSRGSLVDEAALADALGKGHLAAAALDVYQTEPYAGPLCGLPNVVLTPHVATFTKEARGHMEMQAVENAVGFLRSL